MRGSISRVPKRCWEPIGIWPKAITLCLPYLTLFIREDGSMGKVAREISVIKKMVLIYCRGNHHPDSSKNGLCPDCSSLLAYAELKLQRCPHGEAKPSCKDCSIHCYNKEYRVTIREVMKYSGWRFMLRHPIQSLLKKIG